MFLRPKEAGFKLYWGADARKQSPDMGDVLLHETAVSWFRKRMSAERPEVFGGPTMHHDGSALFFRGGEGRAGVVRCISAGRRGHAVG